MIRIIIAVAAAATFAAGCGSSVDQELAERVAEKYYADLQDMSEAEAESQCATWDDPAVAGEIMDAWVTGFVNDGDSQAQAELMAAELYDANVAFCAVRG